MTAPSPFLPDTQIQFAWDSTSLGYFKECPRKYQLTILEGWRSSESSMHLVFGGHYAKAMERFFRWQVEFNLTHDETLTLVIWACLQDSYGWETGDTKKNRDTLIRSIVWYFHAYRDDVCKTVILADGSPAVELTYRWDTGIQVGSNIDHTYLLTGHLDRVVDFGGTTYIQDQKTTGSTLSSYYFDQFNPDNQMTGYTLAGQVVFNLPVKGVMIDAAQIAVGFTAFSRGITTRSNGQLEEWLHDFSFWMETARRYAEANHWPMNEKSCNNYGKCTFHDICNKDSAVREAFLKTSFVKRYWNPLEVR